MNTYEYTLYAYLYIYSISRGTWRNAHPVHTLDTDEHTRWWTGISPANLFLSRPLPTLLFRLEKTAAFVRAEREDCKCRLFYYLALKARHAATVIISTAVLFYKIVKDDETALAEREYLLSPVLEGSLPEEVFQPTKISYRRLSDLLSVCLSLFHLCFFSVLFAG